MKSLSALLSAVAFIQVFSHCEAFFLCKLPPPTKDATEVSRGPIIWYEIRRYFHPLLELNGQMIADVEPLGEKNVTVNASFSKNNLKLQGKGYVAGHELIVQYEGILGSLVSGHRNIVCTDNKRFYVDHFCLLGKEVSTIFYYKPTITDEEMEDIYNIVEKYPEVDRTRYHIITP